MVLDQDQAEEQVRFLISLLLLGTGDNEHQLHAELSLEESYQPRFRMFEEFIKPQRGQPAHPRGGGEKAAGCGAGRWGASAGSAHAHVLHRGPVLTVRVPGGSQRLWCNRLGLHEGGVQALAYFLSSPVISLCSGMG